MILQGTRYSAILNVGKKNRIERNISIYKTKNVAKYASHPYGDPF